MDKKFIKCRNHVIICGLGATANQIINIMEDSGLKNPEDMSRTAKINIRKSQYLVIEKSSDSIEKALYKWPEMMFIEGDATDDDVLEQACIKDAFGIFPILSSERDNLYITLAARQMNPDIRVVARTADYAGIGKRLLRAGANSVISPNMLGGLRMVSEISRPHATAFLDELLHTRDTNIQIEEITVSNGSSISGLTLKEIELPKKTGLNVIAIKKDGDKYHIYNPSADMKINTGDTLIVLGYWDQMNTLRRLAQPFSDFSADE